MTASAPPASDAKLMIGIFVGGSSTRMHGFPKGNLEAPLANETLLERLRRIATQTLPDAALLLVGARFEYAASGLYALADNPSGIGPIGGLRALLIEAQARGTTRAIALACDLPFLDGALLARLASDAPAAAAVIPIADGQRQPLAAAYAPAAALRAIDRVLAAGAHSLMAVLDALATEVYELRLEPAEERLLKDWDEPADLIRLDDEIS